MDMKLNMEDKILVILGTVRSAAVLATVVTSIIAPPRTANSL